MIGIQVKEVHIGNAIKKRLEELGMTKSEFGRRIDVLQQHINRLLERDTIETKRLVKICHALKFNFFALYCKFPASMEAYFAEAVPDNEEDHNLDESALLAEIELYKEKVSGMQTSSTIMEDQIQTLKNQVEQLKSQLQDKEEIIHLVKNIK